MTTILGKIALCGLACTVWSETSMTFAQEVSANVSVSIYASACSKLGVPVQSFPNQVTVDGTAIGMPYFLVMIDELDLRLMMGDGTVDLDKLKADYSIVPVKNVNDEVKAGGRELSAEGKQMVVDFCRLFK